LLGRVAWLQIIKPDNLVKQEDMRSLRELAIDAPRGMIGSRRTTAGGERAGQAVWADPKTVLAKGGVGLMNAGRRWRMRCISPGTLSARITQPAGAFIYLARQVDPDRQVDR
jgi:cell division protein FtsI (penicillin-binding protein 3)